ncbi:GFA family protein [Phenylobacterium sp.]|uniref:GFA family protein n=1 Tax=Phenylobacterium sp. TaxID=1871053 RepID=UPI002FCB0503
MIKLGGSCGCGVCAFEATAAPRARFICHCTICQAFTGKAFSDVAVLPAKVVRFVNAQQIEYRTYRSPPNINRGHCRACGGAVAETAGFGPAKIVFVPAQNFKSAELLPPPRMHVFYEHRKADVADGLPKHEGYWRSQAAIISLLFRSL